MNPKNNDEVVNEKVEREKELQLLIHKAVKKQVQEFAHKKTV